MLMIDQLQAAWRHSRAVDDVDVVLIVVEEGILVRGDLPSGIIGVKRHLATWQQVADGMLPKIIDIVVGFVRNA